jgi:hypothetical protein
MRFRRPREKNDNHLHFIRSLPCASCIVAGRTDDTSTEAAHLRTGNLEYGKRSTGLAEKPHDMWVLPLCGRCHRAQHSANEINFWANLGIDPFRLALSLFAASGDHELAHEVLERQIR